MQQFEAIKYQAISEINNPLQTDTSSTRNVVAKPRSASSADALFGLPQMSSPIDVTGAGLLDWTPSASHEQCTTGFLS